MSRTREFDEGEVIASAMRVFWELGYDGASMPDLLDATGLSRSSLYETFGDKNGLFLRTVHAYATRAAQTRKEIFSHPDGLVAGLRVFLARKIQGSQNTGYPEGCYLTTLSASLKTADEALRRIVIDTTDATEREYLALFAEARERGDISGKLSAQEWTNAYQCFSWGLNVAQRMGRSRASLEAMAHAFLVFLES
jgi:TetR/AcrR family transcriptional regulator, transcriptional repressor for nem operon